MTFTDTQIQDFLKKNFQMEASVKALPGELDFNYFVLDSKGHSYIAKIANLKEHRSNLELQNAVINHLSGKQDDLIVSQVVKSMSQDEILEITDPESNIRLFRLLTWVDGRVLANTNPHSPALLERLGEMCGKLCTSLSDFDHPSAHRFMKWDPSQAPWIEPHLDHFTGNQKDIVKYFYELYVESAVPYFSSLRKSINYNDANNHNVLVSLDVRDPHVPGVIDFGDVVYTHTINELAIAIAYAILDKPDPLEAALPIVKGFNKSFKLTEDELAVLFPLVAIRLVISVTCSELNRADHPENVYLQISDKPAWDMLTRLKDISPSLAHMIFRSACDKVPCPTYEEFNSWASQAKKEVTFPVKISDHPIWLDLSVGSLDIGSLSNLVDPDTLDRRISRAMHDANTSVSIGRYNEARSFYTTDSFAAVSNDKQVWRTVHIGMDFFSKPGTEVYSVCDGVIHSFANNVGDKDYGPTIILEHHVSDSLKFYTLYGHLSSDSLIAAEVGKKIKKGELIARIGSRTENGNWPPHLHFQVILDMLGKQGDFQGVAYAHQRTVWTSISPDPWLLLTGTSSENKRSRTANEIIDFRTKHLGKNLSISYSDPIKMVRGSGVYLLDETGRRFLDTVNNVAHVGHEHPKVVLAGQRQMAVLNTNTRYLHDNLVKFVEALLQTMPSQLSVAYVVNSGSEANELALRLAKNFTGQRDMIVSEVGYHGNTNACVEISAYKFDGRGGKGAEPHIHVVPIPDVYRGLYRADDLIAGSNYASHVGEAVKKIHSLGRQPAALIFESVLSCGGQVELPNNFLKESYEHVRKAGGVCIADEVQTGCGRPGDHFWVFQQHDVVPDIVTIGKPIGNGHPLGVVVTTQKISDTFHNGMEYFNTFGGNPVSCAIGYEVLNVIKEDALQDNAKRVGDYLKSGLKNLMTQFEIIGDVRGPGLFIGFELVTNRETKAPATEHAMYLVNRMRDKGILMSSDGPFNNVIKIKPPMVFSRPNSDFLIDTIAKVLKEDFMKSLD